MKSFCVEQFKLFTETNSDILLSCDVDIHDCLSFSNSVRSDLTFGADRTMLARIVMSLGSLAECWNCYLCVCSFSHVTSVTLVSQE